MWSFKKYLASKIDFRGHALKFLKTQSRNPQLSNRDRDILHMAHKIMKDENSLFVTVYLTDIRVSPGGQKITWQHSWAFNMSKLGMHCIDDILGKDGSLRKAVYDATDRENFLASMKGIISSENDASDQSNTDQSPV